MRRQTLGVFLATAMSAALIFGAVGASAKPGNGNAGGNGNGNSDQLKPHQLASQACVEQHHAIGNKAFKALYGKRAMRTCKKQETADVQAAVQNASQECKAEAADPNFATEHGGATFAEFYGTNANDANAHGKCVSGKVKAQQAAEQEQLVNAAQACRAERSDPNFAAGHDGKSFADFYGTNANKKNAFGKCVSKKAHEANAGGGTA